MPKSSIKKTSNLLIQKVLNETQLSGKASHPVGIATKIPGQGRLLSKKHITEWFIKAESPPSDPPKTPLEIEQAVMEREMYRNTALREVVAQEFFRFIIPTHPKTRFAMNELGDGYLLSKRVPGGVPLQHMKASEIYDGIISGRFKGLGEILVLALFLQEIDLKYGNMFVDKDGNIVKIDGDWCFARLRYLELDIIAGKIPRTYNKEITSGMLTSLPFAYNYEAHNWLDGKIEGIAIHNPATVKLINDLTDYIKHEKHYALLKILVMPDELLKHFVNQYISNDSELAKNVADEMIQRKKSLRNAAMHDNAFKAYMQSEQSRDDLDIFINQMNQFKTTGKNKLFKANAYDPYVVQEYHELATLTTKMQTPAASEAHITATTPIAEAEPHHNASLTDSIYSFSSFESDPDSPTVIQPPDLLVAQPASLPSSHPQSPPAEEKSKIAEPSQMHMEETDPPRKNLSAYDVRAVICFNEHSENPVSFNSESMNSRATGNYQIKPQSDFPS